MAPEISLLVWSVALCLVQVVIAACGTVLQIGLPTAAGNRADMPPFAGWVGRAHRAHRNMLESLVLFGALVLAVVATASSNATTVLGAQLFFWCRLAYAVIYLAGIPWLRTLAWGVSIGGLVMMLTQVI